MSEDRREAIVGRLHEAWAALEGARMIADNNGDPWLANEIKALRREVGELEGRLGLVESA